MIRWIALIGLAGCTEPGTAQPPRFGEDPTADTATTPIFSVPERADCTAVETLDWRDDGLIEMRWERVYDERGLLQVVATDREPDGHVDVRVWHAWDAAGDPILVSTDADGDGIADDAVRTLYEDRAPFREQVDYGLDDVLDVVTTWENLDGRPLRMERDDGADGEIDAVHTWTWDSRGRIEIRKWDDGADGTLDGLETYTYYDAGPSHDLRVQDYATGEDLLETALFDELDRPVLHTWDDGNDGLVTRSHSWSYADTSDRVDVEIEVADAAGAALETVTAWRYDEAGRAIEAYRTGHLAAGFNSRTTLRWQCP